MTTDKTGTREQGLTARLELGKHKLSGKNS
jgi:hypothetical protein